MADSFNVWPSGVPTSYSGESFPLPKTESLPALYGIDLGNPFFLSFLAGAAFVAFFSITRFNRRSRDPSDPVTAESKLLDRLTPADLRDPRLIFQAYLLYAAVLLGLYTALTFYGRIILDWVNNVLPTVGYTDTGNFDFSSPQWPLMVALAMIGVLPVLPPVEAVEVRLRHWTHRAVGIPLTIYRHSEAMRSHLRQTSGVSPGELPDFDKDIPPWVKDVADRYSINHAFQAKTDLDRLIRWTMTGRGEWPTGETNRAVEALFDERTAAAQKAVHEFEVQVLRRNLATPPKTAGADHLTKLRRDWEQGSAQVIAARDELLALLAVGAEKQSDYGLIKSDALRDLLNASIPVDRFQRGPQVSVALLVPLLLLGFGFAIRFAWHYPAVGNDAKSFSVIAVSALYEVLLVVILFLLPLMAALNYRFWRLQAWTGRWHDLHVLSFEQRGMVQVLVAGLLALVVSVTGLALLAIAQAFVSALNSRHFTRLLFEQDYALMPLAVSLAGVSVIYCLMVLFAMEEKEHGAGPLKLVWMGFLCALAILGYQMLHLYFWYGGGAYWKCGTIFLELLPQGILERFPTLFAGELALRSQCTDAPGAQEFSRYYNLVSILTNTMIGFLSIACFLPDRQPARPPYPVVVGNAPGAAAGLLLLMLLATLPTAAVGQAAETADPVLVGFRADAPPFSSIKRVGEQERYEGYLVDLCNRIFAPDRGERYRMVKTQVTSADRFVRLARTEAERWRPGQPIAGAKIDLLCDPVTLRYASESDEPVGARRTDGVFSPIVFVTGVSYLERSTGGLATTVLGFVGGTTARKVVLQACEHDAFRERARRGTQSDADAIRACAADLENARDKFDAARQRSDPERLGPMCNDESLPDSGLSGYRFCLFANHTAAAAWFCMAQPKGALYYFGDKDLILGQVEWRAKAGKCDVQASDQPFYSYEPYALLISPADSELVKFVQRRVYEIFSDRSEALGLFASNFEGKAMSVPLANLFLLNGVEDEVENARRAAEAAAE